MLFYMLCVWRSVIWPTSLSKSLTAGSISSYHPLPSAPSRWVLTFYSVGHPCPHKHQQRHKNWSSDTWVSSQYDLWKGGWKLDLRAPKSSYKYLLGYSKYHEKQLQAGLGGHRNGICTERLKFADTGGCIIPFHIFRLFLVCYYKDRLYCNSYEGTVQAVGAWSCAWSEVPLQLCSPTPTKFALC